MPKKTEKPAVEHVNSEVELHYYYPGWGLPSVQISESEFMRLHRNLEFAEIKFRTRTVETHYIDVLEGEGYKGEGKS